MRPLKIIFVFFLFSCIADGPVPHPLPDAIILNITAVNEMDESVTIKIRHKYSWYSIIGNTPRNVETEYTDWVPELFASGESRPIGVENIVLNNGYTTEVIDGFVLLDSNVAPILTQYNYSLSSFELEIETSHGITFVPAYHEITDRNSLVFLKTDLCALRITNPFNTCFLITNLQEYNVRSSVFSLEAELIINADGGYSFIFAPFPVPNPAPSSIEYPLCKH